MGTDTLELNSYVVRWSFNNPTELEALARGSSEEEATKGIIEAFSEAPEFRITGVEKVTQEELEERYGLSKADTKEVSPRVLN